MKTIYKILAATLLATMLLALFASCQTDGGTTETTPSPTTPSETTPPTVESSIKLVENGQSAFKVVIPQYATRADETRIEKFVNSFKSKTGVELVMIDDTDELYGNDNYEILIGDVKRKECEDILAQLRNNEYFYGVVGNKLVITGKDDTALEDAIQFFLRKVIDTAVSTDKANITLESKNNYFYKYNYPIDNMLIGNTPIYNYSIVYSKDDSNAATVAVSKLANLILSYTGFEIPVIADTKDPTPYEIVFGDTNRGTPSTASRDMFSVVCKDEKLYISSGLAIGYDSLHRYLQKIFSRADEDKFAIENGFSYQESISASLSEGTENMLGKGGTVRAMFHNVLIHERPTAPTTWRAKYALDVYRDYAPDVIGLQEMQGTIRTAISMGLKKLGYKEVTYDEKNSTFSFYEDPVFYNPETLNLITSGAHRFHETVDRNKSIGWALFEEKATGKRFIVASTHYVWLENYDYAYSHRIQNAQQTVAKLQELVSKYNVPVILGGDFNSNQSTSAYSILKNGGLKDVEDIAIKTENSNTHHDEPVFNTDTKLCEKYFAPTGDDSAAIDHIFSYNDANVTFNTYDVITDPFALATSDHCPLLVDFTLN